MLWRVFDVLVVEDKDQQITLKITGDRVLKVFANEAGGHRWQHAPNNGGGKIHSSTITVALMNEFKPKAVKIDPKDIELSFTKGSGPGGQKRNKRILVLY